MLAAGCEFSSEWAAACLVEATAYTYPALSIHLQLGLRSFELDVYYDPAGGHFSNLGFFAPDQPGTFAHTIWGGRAGLAEAIW